MEEQLNFFPLLLVLFLAFAVPLLLGRIRWLPIIVGEIAAGILIGPSVLDLVQHSTILEIISDMGLAFLMFLAGMEINFRQLFPADRSSQSSIDRSLLTLTPVVYLLTLALAVPGGFALNALGFQADPWLLAFILSATSLGIVLPILKQRGLTHTVTGRAIFYSSLLADFLTVLLLTIYLILIQRGLNVEILSVSVLFLVFFLLYQLGLRFFRIPVIQNLIEELSHVTVQIKVRGAITILMAFVVLASFLSIEIILGAFLAGLMISLLRAPEDTEIVEKLETFGYGFFIPVFFILVGASLDLRNLVESPGSLLLLPVLFLVAILVKTVPMLLFRRMLSWRETFAAASLVDSHLSIEIAVAVIGVRLGLIDEAANVTIVLFATLTVLLMPVLFNFLLPHKEAEAEPQQILIYGAEDLGIQVARVLSQHGETVRFLEPEPQRHMQASRQGFELICNTNIPGCLELALEKATVKALLVLSSNDTRNLLVCYSAVRLGIEQVVALLNDPKKLPEYRGLGVKTYNPTMSRANVLAVIARSPDFFTLMTTTTDDQDIREVHVRNPLYTRSAIKNLNLTGNMTIVAIARDHSFIVPHDSTYLELGDRLTLFGETADINRTAELMEHIPHPY